MSGLSALLARRATQRALLVALLLAGVLLQAAYLANAIAWRNAPDRGWIAMVQLGPTVVAEPRPLGAAAGLRRGDVIVTLNGRAYDTYEELWEILDPELGATNVYEIDRAGERLVVEVVNQPLGFERVALQSGVFWLLGTLILALGFLVFAMKPWHGPSWAFTAMCVLLGVVLPHFAPSYHVFEPKILNNVVLLFWPLVPATLLTLAMLFPQRKPALLSRRRWLLLPYAVSAGLAIASRASADWVGFLPPTLLTLLYGYLLLAVVGFLGSTLYDYLRTDRVAVRLQSLVIFTGLTLAFLLPALEMLSNLIFRVSLFPNLIVAYASCLLFFPLAVGYAIARHDLFEISTVVRRTYGYILSSGAVVGAYSIVLSLFDLTAFSGVTESRVFSAVTLVAVAFSFQPIHRRSQDLVDRVFYRQRYDYRRTIRATSERMTTILEPEEVQHTLVDTLVGEMLLESGVLLLPDASASEFRAALTVGETPPREELRIAFDHPVVGCLREIQNPIFQHDVDLAPEFESQREVLAACFSALEADVLIAMASRDETVGILALGPKKSRRMIALEDVDLIQTLVYQAVIALQNARLFSDLSASLKQIQILESVKANLTKFVPKTVQDLIEESPEAPLLDKREEDVSVMFADITGYTAMSSRLSLDELNGIIERYFGAFLDEIIHCGGDVNETSGDGLMVIFRDPDPRKHARAAVEASLGIQRRSRELNAEVGDPDRHVIMHVGVNSGITSVGATKLEARTGERWTFTASGPTTNVAARLSGMPEARRRIVVSDATRDRLGDDYAFEDLGPQWLKNVEEPVQAWRIEP